MKREQRLRTPADFRRVRELAGRGVGHRLIVVYAAPNELPQARVGVTVSGRVGKAVVRNRVRRRLRAAIAARLEAIPGGTDVVVMARPASASASWAELCCALDAALREALR